jgi:hypothetical protein
MDLLMTKNGEKKFLVTKKFIFFFKIAIHLSHVPHDVQAVGEAFSHPALKNIKFLHFFHVCGVFALLDPDPDPTDQNDKINADLYGSGSTTLITYALFCRRNIPTDWLVRGICPKD